jgi:hypothetical protein
MPAWIDYPHLPGTWEKVRRFGFQCTNSEVKGEKLIGAVEPKRNYVLIEHTGYAPEPEPAPVRSGKFLIVDHQLYYDMDTYLKSGIDLKPITAWTISWDGVTGVFQSLLPSKLRRNEGASVKIPPDVLTVSTEKGYFVYHCEISWQD